MEEICRVGPKIVGGEPSQWHDAPFQASLRDLRYDRAAAYGGGHFCGGAIITKRVIISAASCIHNRQAYNIGVVVGSLHRRMETGKSTQLLFVDKLIAEPVYTPGSPRNDIGLLILKTFIQYGEYVHPVPITYKSPKTGTKCQIFGWGQTSTNHPYYSECLQKATVPVQDWKECEKKALENNFQLPKTTLCVGSFEGGPDSCIGDSGGPLVCGGNLCGIISDRVGCGEYGLAKMYTDVYALRQWIEKIIQQYGSKGNKYKKCIFFI